VFTLYLEKKERGKGEVFEIEGKVARSHQNTEEEENVSPRQGVLFPPEREK